MTPVSQCKLQSLTASKSESRNVQIADIGTQQTELWEIRKGGNVQKGRVQHTIVAAVAVLATLDDHIRSHCHERPVSIVVRVKSCRIGNANVDLGVGAHDVLLEWVDQLLVAAQQTEHAVVLVDVPR